MFDHFLPLRWFSFVSASTQEGLCCAWLLWRLHSALGLSARELVRELVDDARFDGLTFQRKKRHACRCGVGLLCGHVWPILDITRIGHRGEVCRCLLSHDHMITYWIVSICWSTQWSIFQQAILDETGFQDNGWQQMIDIAKALVVRARDVRGDPSTSLGEERQGPWEVHGDTETDIES